MAEHDLPDMPKKDRATRDREFLEKALKGKPWERDGENKGTECLRCGKFCGPDSYPHYCNSDAIYVHTREKLRAAAEKANVEGEKARVGHPVRATSGITYSGDEPRMMHRPGCNWYPGDCTCGADKLNAFIDRQTEKHEALREKFDSTKYPYQIHISKATREEFLKTLWASLPDEIIEQIKAKDEYIEGFVRAAQPITEVKEWAGTMEDKYRYYTTTLDERIGALEQALKGE